MDARGGRPWPGAGKTSSLFPVASWRLGVRFLLLMTSIPKRFLSATAPQLPSTYHASATRYDQMPFRRAGRSGLLLPSISLGLWQNFGEADPIANSQPVLRRSFDLGTTHFNSPSNYEPPQAPPTRPSPHAFL